MQAKREVMKNRRDRERELDNVRLRVTTVMIYMFLLYASSVVSKKIEYYVIQLHGKAFNKQKQKPMMGWCTSWFGTSQKDDGLEHSSVRWNSMTN